MNDRSEVSRLALQGRSAAGSTKSKPKSLVPLAQTCNQLRNEYLPLCMSHLHVGLASIDLDRFLEVFCRTVGGHGSTRTLCPHAITVYIPDTFIHFDLTASREIDLMPLLKFRFKVPRLVCHFEIEPNLHAVPHGYRPISISVLQDVSFLFNYNNKLWKSFVEGQQLSQVVLSPYKVEDCVNMELVFREQPFGRRLGAGIQRCYLPDVQRLGLTGVYHKTGLILGSTLKARADASQS